MANSKNMTGMYGEYYCGTELMRPLTATVLPIFEAVLLGGKAPTYDYIVHLLDSNCDRLGPFFFLQVKTTAKPPGPSGSYSLNFSASAVAKARATKVPFFLAVVDTSQARQEKIFIRGLDAARKGGVSRLAPTYDLALDLVKTELYNEVKRIWSTQSASVLTKLI